MEQSYWLGRRRASAANTRSATSAEARLAHLDFAGRHSDKAPEATSPGADGGGDSAYYERLEAGARWLAGRAATAGERREHLGQADRYRHLRLDVAHGGR